MRSSLLPLASIILVDESEPLGIGESARQRMAEVWALKRNESENFTSGSASSSGFVSLEPSFVGCSCFVSVEDSPFLTMISAGLRILDGMAAIIPCNARS